MNSPLPDAGPASTGSQHLLVVTGPESSGKTTLADRLAEELTAPLVPEVARSYLAAKSTPGYGPEDVRNIATGQAQIESETLARGTRVVVADTDHRVIQLWWDEKYPDMAETFGPASDAVTVQRHYLLCYPDLAWEPDPMRENPLDRMRLFKRQLGTLERDQAEFRVIWGAGRLREQRALVYVREALDSS